MVRQFKFYFHSLDFVRHKGKIKNWMGVLETRILGIDFSLNIREDVDVEENFRRCSAAKVWMLM